MSHEREYWNPEREGMPRDELAALQDEKVARQVSRGYHNAPVIRDLWDEAGVTPDDVQSVEDLARAPVFRKDIVRERMVETGEPFGGRLSMPQSELTEGGASLHSSSGTTGISTCLVLSPRDQRILAEITARHLWQAGLRPGDTLVNFNPTYNPNLTSVTHAAHLIGAPVIQIDHNPNEISRVAHALEYLEPTVISGVSGPSINMFNNHYEDEGVDPVEAFDSVDAAIMGGEPLFDEIREDIQSQWDIELFEISGGLEPGWQAVECSEHGRWVHVQSDHLYVEARDPETGERVPDGERGELIFTALSYEAMSHVCWAHDDIVEIRRGECACGRTGAQVKFIGRIGDLLTVDGQSVLPIDVSSVVYGVEEMPSSLFQFYADSTEALRLKLGYDPDRTDDTDELAARVRDRVASSLDMPVEIVELVPESELLKLGPEHKIPRITSE